MAYLATYLRSLSAYTPSCCSVGEIPLTSHRRPRRKRKRHYHTGTHVSPKAGECRYRSGWELAFMQHLDADPTVSSYSYEGFFIPYVSNVRSGKVRKYWPDFLVTRTDGSQQIVEVKPKKRLEQARVKKKLVAAEEWSRAHGVTLVVLTEVELGSMGVL